MLAGALVELQFELPHFPIGSKNVDSFNASVEQVQILEPGQECPPTLFKCKDISEGPIRVSPFMLTNAQDHGSSHKRPWLHELETPTRSSEAPFTETVPIDTSTAESNNDDTLEIEQSILEKGLCNALAPHATLTTLH